MGHPSRSLWLESSKFVVPTLECARKSPLPANSARVAPPARAADSEGSNLGEFGVPVKEVTSETRVLPGSDLTGGVVEIPCAGKGHK